MVPQAAHGGVACPADGDMERHMPCNEHDCPVDCVMEQWGNWSPCTKTCGSGGTYRTRGIKSGPLNGGKKCPNEREPLVGTKPCKDGTKDVPTKYTSQMCWPSSKPTNPGLWNLEIWIF